MIRHLIFDLDGTLVDSCTICVDILATMLSERGSQQQIDPIGARPWMSVGGQAMVAALLGADCRDPAEEIAEFRKRYRGTDTPRSSLFDGVADGLVRLHKAGFTLSICSNKPQFLCEKVLSDTGLDHVFKVVVGTRDGLDPKPAPDLVDATLASLGASPAECLFIGDSELDHHVAEAAGIPFAFMTYGYAKPGWAPNDAATVSYDSFPVLVRAIIDRLAAADAA
jgi:phosphoglycolate phosphatase